MTHKEILKKAEKMLKEKKELTEVFEWREKHNSKSLYMVPSKCNVHLIMESDDPEEYMWHRPHAIYLEDDDKVILVKASTYNVETDIFTYIDYETGEKKEIKVRDNNEKR